MKQYLEMVDKHQQAIVAAHDYIWQHPETGYREWKTHSYLEKAFRELGYDLVMPGDIPGFYTDIDTGRPGPTLLIFGELDALICGTHPDAEAETGAVHACGHHLQAAALLGLAAALKEPGALDGLSGKIRLMAVPAEELIELEYRKQLRAEGKIHYFGGKVEFMYRGYLDGCDLSFMIHAGGGPVHSGSIGSGSNGCIVKSAIFEGKASHAGGAPHQGINALYAANLALNAINSLRETFRDSDHIRVHPIITAGGEAVNAIPERVVIENYVRGATMESITAANAKVNRATAAAAAALGAKVTLCDTPGYWPRYYDPGMMQVMKEAMEAVLEKVTFNPAGWGTGCSDIGDVSTIMPTVHPSIGGATGTAHGNDFRVPEPAASCVDSVKVQFIALRLLLENHAQRAREIVENYKPRFACKEDYFAYVDQLAKDQQAVNYDPDGSIWLTF